MDRKLERSFGPKKWRYIPSGRDVLGGYYLSNRIADIAYYECGEGFG